MVLAITNVNPNTGLTGGREMTIVQGTDFNTAVDSEGVSRMNVKFGTVDASRIRVRSVTELDCLTPIHDLGQVDVTVEDLDAVTSATLTNGFTFARPEIGGATYNSDLWRTVKTLAEEMKRQILEEVVLGPEVDYDDTPFDGMRITKLAKVPALVLDGPRIIGANGVFYRVREPWVQTAVGPPREFNRKRPQDYVDLQFTLFVVDDKKIRLLNLQKEVISFFRRNAVLRVLADPAQPSGPYEEVDMRPPRPQDWRMTMRGNKSSLKFCAGQFTLFGVPLGHDEVYDETRGFNEFIVTSKQL